MNPLLALGTLRDSNGQLITSDIDKAEAFNNFFHSVCTFDDNQLPYFPHRTDALMEMSQFTTAEFRDAIFYSFGLDGCPSKSLKLFPELCTPLSSLFNMSISQQIVLDAWRLAHVIPIFKGKGSKFLVENYKPIILTNVFSKLM